MLTSSSPVALFLVFICLTCPSINCEDEIINSSPDASKSAAQVESTVHYSTPNLDSDGLFKRHLYESFDDEILFNQKWIQSKATKAESEDLKYDGDWDLVTSHSSIRGDRALLMKSRAKHHAISAKLDEPFLFDKETELILQYEVQFRSGQECGGAYIKLLASPSGKLQNLNDKTQYSIMFGPDKCGNDHKLHFIFNHRNPKNGTLREIHWKKALGVSKLDDAVKDSRWHLFRLRLQADNTFEISMDKKVVGKGSLLEDFTPPVNPAREIDDPNDKKPEEWDEREKIPDPDARKPDDWDENQPKKIADPHAKKPSDWNESEPEMVPDPDASKPSDWDPDMDGEWQAPLIANPKCVSLSGCGPWKAPLIDNPLYKGKWRPNLIANPNYRGKWAPRKIRNPDFFEDLTPFKMLPIDAVAFELWTITDNIAFDNVLLSNDLATADYVLDKTFQIKKDLVDEETDSLFVKLIKYTNKRPWLWAVYVLVIAVPVILFIAYCCLEPVSKKSSDEEIIGRRKKTDEYSPDSEPVASSSSAASTSRATIQEVIDDEMEVDEEEQPQATAAGEARRSPTPLSTRATGNITPVSASRKSSRTSPAPATSSPSHDELEEEEEEIEEEVVEDEVEQVDSRAGGRGYDDSGDVGQEEVQDEEEEEEEIITTRTSPRQRKVRSRKDD